MDGDRKAPPGTAWCNRGRKRFRALPVHRMVAHTQTHKPRKRRLAIAEPQWRRRSLPSACQGRTRPLETQRRPEQRETPRATELMSRPLVLPEVLG